MASTREIRRRIRSIGSTAQITRAMQMVAASKMRKAQQAAIDVRPFVQLLYRMQRTATTHAADFTHPLLEVREVRKRAIILVGLRQGPVRRAQQQPVPRSWDGRTRIRPCSSRPAARRRSSSPARADSSSPSFPYGDTPRFAESRAIAALARDLFLKGEVDEVKIVATRFVNTLVQQPVDVRVPAGRRHQGRARSRARRRRSATERRRWSSCSSRVPSDIIEYLLGHYLNILVHVVLLNAKASEQSARMVSMKGATDNAADMIKDLTLEYNKLRQGRITQELLEIAGGQAG